MNFESMKEIIVRAAKEAGLDEYELYYYADEDMSVGALKQEIDSFSSGNSQGIDFRCKVNGKMGYASTELITEEELTELVSRAMTRLIFSPARPNMRRSRSRSLLCPMRRR